MASPHVDLHVGDRVVRITNPDRVYFSALGKTKLDVANYYIAVGKGGTRTIKAADFFQGALTTALEPDEIVTEIHLPAWPAARRWAFQEFARRRGDFAMAGVALYYDVNGGKAANAHIGVIGVGDCQRRLPKAEAALNGKTVDEALAVKVGEAAAAEVEPQEDIHASAAYRRALTGTLAERALKAAAARPAK